MSVESAHPTQHARFRWQQRVGTDPQDLHEAWDESKPVKAPDVDGNARLVERDDRDILLVSKRMCITTVLYANREDYWEILEAEW